MAAHGVKSRQRVVASVRGRTKRKLITLLKELIDIPEHVGKGQFVLRLTEGVTDPIRIVDAYVVAPCWNAVWDDVLSFSRGLLQGIREWTPLARPASGGKSRKQREIRKKLPVHTK